MHTYIYIYIYNSDYTIGLRVKYLLYGIMDEFFYVILDYYALVTITITFSLY